MSHVCTLQGVMNVEQMWLLVGSVGSVALCTTVTQLLHIGGTKR